MAKKRNTVFQALDKAITGNWKSPSEPLMPHINSYDLSASSGNKVLYQTSNKEDYEQKKLELQQDKYLRDRWVKANVNLSVSAYSGLNNIKLMYRDADLMDAFPEIGAALTIVSEESTIPNPDTGNIINVYSKSKPGDYGRFRLVFRKWKCGRISPEIGRGDSSRLEDEI